ncbi:helix-turn-helix domain-containing protein [Paenibacillus hunanensis]|uniref:helix-turn-helix transcriptional regulator n=1 Tax=Paenibacillus hunanensis TaxID=539262 RepID=UPI0020267D3D|nr:helix-turn-helix domain-containing protein [Paenibacillus hunanensis]MCL9662111.1 helix-turn-helix domain-containing protein [Paenibacillus hunanensis]
MFKKESDFIVENRIKELREKNGESQAELGFAIGTSRQTIINMENHRTEIAVKTGFKIAKHYGCDINYLFIPKHNIEQFAQQ